MAMSRVFYILLALTVALAGLAFHVRNSQEIVLDYVLGTVAVELSWVVVAAVIIGAALGMLGMTSSVFKLRRELWRLKRQHDQSNRELSSLKAIALKDGG